MEVVSLPFLWTDPFYFLAKLVAINDVNSRSIISHKIGRYKDYMLISQLLGSPNK
jgi:hypothetical protein